MTTREFTRLPARGETSMKRRFYVKPLAKPTKTMKVGIFDARYRSLVSKVSCEAAAALWIEQQTAEDRANRLWRVRDYLAERAKRVPAVAEAADDSQLTFGF
jgi:hypothetical protein